MCAAFKIGAVNIMSLNVKSTYIGFNQCDKKKEIEIKSRQLLSLEKKEHEIKSRRLLSLVTANTSYIGSPAQLRPANGSQTPNNAHV